MKKKGFTMIELLATIVVISIISLIATPMILNVIETSKKGAFEQSLNGVLKGAELYQIETSLKNDLSTCRYFSFGNDVNDVTVRGDKTYYPLENLKLKGELPTEGELQICSDVITFEASNGKYSGSYNGDNITINKGDLASNDFKTPIIDVFNLTAKVDKIIVSAHAYSPSAGGIIVNYYYKIDNGEYIKTSDASHIFEDLEPNTEYTIGIKVENKSGVIKEESKTVKTKSFGEITISVENSDVWKSSKKVTITGTTSEFPLEYKIEYYNSETSSYESTEFTTYTESFDLDKMSTAEYPTVIIARYKDDEVYSEPKTYNVSKIDTTAPILRLEAITQTTKTITIPFTAIDTESDIDNTICVYGETEEYGKTGTVNGNTCTISGLTAGTTYYYKLVTTNNSGLTDEKASDTSSGSTGISYGTTQSPEETTYAQSKNVTVTYTINNVTNGVRYLKTSVDTTSSVDGYACGTGTDPETCGTTATKNFVANTWYKVASNPTVTFTSNGTVYARINDGAIYSTASSHNVEKIDTTAPNIPSITNPTSGNWTNSSFSLTVSSSDSGSGISYWQYSFDNSNWVTYSNSASNTFTTTPFSAERNQLAYIRVCDALNQCSTSASTYIRIDKTAPSAPTTMGMIFNDWSTYSNDTWTNRDVYIATTSSSPGPSGATDTNGSGVAKYQISTNNSNWVDYSYNYADSMYYINTEGTTYRYFRAVDAAGNAGPSITRTIKIDRTVSVPTVTYNEGYNIYAIQKYYKILLNSSAKSGILNYEIDWNNDGVVDTTTGSTFEPWNGWWSEGNTRFRAVSNSGQRSEWTGGYIIFRDVNVSDNPIPNGTYKMLSAQDANYAVDICGGSITSGANIQMYVDNNTNAQKFYLEYLNNGYYKILNAAYQNYGLDVDGAAFTAGTNIKLESHNGNIAQQFKILKSVYDGYYIVTHNGGLVLDAYSVGNGGNVYIYYPHSGANQRWNFVETKVFTEFKVGDYVKMTPTSTSYSISTSLTGYSSSQTINPSELNLWRVIRINSDGTIDMVSEYVSSTNVYFMGTTGYDNFVGSLNTIASQYTNSKYTTGARHMGYSYQTQNISVDLNSVVATHSTSSSTTSPEEAQGAGDMGYTTDYNLVNTAVGTTKAYKVSSTSTLTSYWLASRYYKYNSATDRYYEGRLIDSSNYGYYTNAWLARFNYGYYTNSGAYAIRPIVTLKSGLVATGSGTSSSPYVLN